LGWVLRRRGALKGFVQRVLEGLVQRFWGWQQFGRGGCALLVPRCKACGSLPPTDL